MTPPAAARLESNVIRFAGRHAPLFRIAQLLDFSSERVAPAPVSARDLANDHLPVRRQLDLLADDN